MGDKIACVIYRIIVVVKRSFFSYILLLIGLSLSTSKHPGDDIYTWGWGGANGTFFEEGHSSGGQLVSYFLPLQLFVLDGNDVRHAQSPPDTGHIVTLPWYLQGHGNDVDYFEPTMVPFGKNARAVHVSCGFNHTGAIYEYFEG